MHGDIELGRCFPFRAGRGMCSMVPFFGRLRSRLAVFQYSRIARGLRYPQQVTLEQLHLGIYFACKKSLPGEIP